MRSHWQLGHRPSLDALRGIAVLLVLAGHFGLPGMDGAARVGVTMFFALSGYLITALLLTELARSGRVDLIAFYVRRARRLFPALAMLLVCVAVVELVRGEVLAWLPGAAAVGFYVGNWAWIAGDPLRGIAHAWSLAVEEQFYLLWPVSLLILARGGLRLASIATTALTLISLLLSISAVDSPLLMFAGSQSRAKDILIGALIAIASMRRGTDFRVPTPAAILAAFVLLASVPTTFEHPDVAWLWLPSGILVAWFANHPGFIAWRPLTFTGQISYGLYLYHFPLESGTLPLFDGLALWPRATALAVTSYALAIASWFGVERHLVRRSPGRGP